ncbi:MAG: 3'-5' exonuclease [Thermoleophilaceae bacterium]
MRRGHEHAGILTPVPLPQPQGQQREVVVFPPRGHLVVLGTAGSGKTTMAVHRAVYLGDERMDHGGRTLLVTFNRALLAYINEMRPRELRNVEVVNYHAFARGYLNSQGLMGWNWVVEEARREQLVTRALENVRIRRVGESVLQRPPEFFVAELRYLAQHGLVTRAAYLAADRVGRGRALDRATVRPIVFEVFDQYRTLRDAEGFRYDWDDLAVGVRQAFERDGGARMYRHVVVDEGQDFSPEMLRSLAVAVPSGGSLSFFGDVAQQIYGRGLSWRSAGLNVRATKQFTRNYRNSPQIAELGLAIADMPYFAGQPDMVRPTGFAAAGPPPTLVRLADMATETSFVVEQAREAARSGSVAVLTRRQADETRFLNRFLESQRLHRELATWDPNPGISVGTVHSAKGFEFDTVIVVGLSADRWPEPMAVTADGEAEAAAIDGRLLYVAVTRARQNLIMTTTGPLTTLMPARSDLWTETAL